ncbi:hypothetical protein D9M68_715810 [compost metagenome]
MQTQGAWFAQSIGAQGGANTRHEQRLRRVDVAHAHHDVTGQQHLFDRRSSQLQGSVKSQGVKARLKWLHTQAAEQLGRWRGVQRLDIDDRTKTTRVVQTQCALAGQQLKMIVVAATRQHVRKLQTARHAQVQQQVSFIQVEQKVLAPTCDRSHRSSLQDGRFATQRPAQGLAHLQAQDRSSGNAVGKAAPGDFNFGEFGHGSVFSSGHPERLCGLQIRPLRPENLPLS